MLRIHAQDAKVKVTTDGYRRNRARCGDRIFPINATLRAGIQTKSYFLFMSDYVISKDLNYILAVALEA